MTKHADSLIAVLLLTEVPCFHLLFERWFGTTAP